MEAVWDTLKNINYSGIPIAKIVIIIIILTLTQTLRRFFVSVIVTTIERFTKKTQTTLDDELIAIIKPASSWLILIAGFSLSKEILAENLGSQLNQTIGSTLNYIVIFIVGYVVYRGSSILGQLIANVLLHTETELDELLRPLMPKIFQSAAIIVLAIKISEIFLGQSAAALVGLLGGAGITFGLLLKDIVVVHLECLDLKVTWKTGESILTEISRKFDLETVQKELDSKGLKPLKSFTDPQKWFGLILCQASK